MADDMLGYDAWKTNAPDPGTGDGKGNRKLGKCLECGCRGDATEMVQHARTTRHRVEYGGVEQEPIPVKEGGE